MSSSGLKFTGRFIESSIDCLRDPFIVVFEGVYYAYGTGWVYYKNTTGDLASGWEGPVMCVEVPEDAETNFWAPEVHRYNGKFYMFSTYLSKKTGHRGCFIAESDTPEGPFRMISGGHLTPKEWDCIDGTFYIDKEGKPWMVFVHEWTSMPDHVGTMAAARLSDDLTHFISEPIELFRADAPKWAKAGVTDGCFLYRTSDGRLLMTWSNFDAYGYCVAIAESDSGEIDGKWLQHDELLYSKGEDRLYDGGHGMLFRALDGKMYFSMHSPNGAVGDRHEKPVFYETEEE